MHVSSNSANIIPERNRQVRFCGAPSLQSSLPKLPDDVSPILLGSQAAAHLCQLLLGERNSFARDLDEAWLSAGSYGAGESNAVTHHYGPIVAPFRRQTRFVKEKPRRGERGTSRHILWLNTVKISVN